MNTINTASSNIRLTTSDPVHSNRVAMHSNHSKSIAAHNVSAHNVEESLADPQKDHSPILFSPSLNFSKDSYSVLNVSAQNGSHSTAVSALSALTSAVVEDNLGRGLTMGHNFSFLADFTDKIVKSMVPNIASDMIKAVDEVIDIVEVYMPDVLDKLGFGGAETAKNSDTNTAIKVGNNVINFTKGVILLDADHRAMVASSASLSNARQQLAERFLSTAETLPIQADLPVHAAVPSQADVNLWFEGINLADSTNEDVASLVQSALRDAYVAGSQMLMDYAIKVKSFNAQKASLREHLGVVGDTLAKWSTMAQGADDFVSETPVNSETMGPDGVWRQDLNTQLDINAQNVKRAENIRGDSSAAGVFADDERLNGESMLTPAQLDLLEQFVGLMGGSSVPHEMISDVIIEQRSNALKMLLGGGTLDNYISEKLDDLLAIIPSMNRTELYTYLPSIIDTLSSGNMNEDDLMEIYKSLSPMQYVYLRREKVFSFEQEDGLLSWLSDGFSAGQIKDLELLDKANARVVANAAGVDNLTGPGDLHQRNGDSEESNNWPAKLTLAMGHKQQGNDNQLYTEIYQGILDGSQQIGSPKQITTTKELVAYQKKLEMQLSSIGDDAQLANVDLQNELQKQQQLVTMMSNISKMVHDTAMALARRLQS